ncbi:uncharacterized protein LOC113226730 [Hyposmocoma kahamanoa]|uniref:uncharacterized protein LOC113226730 n=1 Tax=Hyposmocoma kahamanoa TaxID=1477025 RepID=UPI000E6D8228|nr:uncharacterized protein LOC113226730 [Hyposmocoma kahamanoa]
MREININIEGYNVNGICVGCLNYGRKMFNHEDVKDCFKILADIDVPDGLSIQVCWECMATIRTVTRFQAQVLHSYEVLIDYSRKHTFLNSPLDLTQYAVQRLSAMIIEDNVQMPQKAIPQMEVKDEFEGKYDIELELPSMLAPPIKEESDYSQDIPDDYLSQDMTSEDDIQLSQLKKEKEKKKKFKKKGKENTKKTQLRGSRDDSRKLKNLPPDMVELYTMTEEEMWQTRNQDLEDKEFTKLKYKCENCLIGFNTEKLMAYHMIGKHRAVSEEL